MSPRKLPTKKDHDFLNLIKDVRYQVKSRHEMHKPVLHRGMLSRSSVRWYLSQCKNDANLAAWMGVCDRELILSANVGYRNELLEIANYLLTKYGKLSTVWNKGIAYECDYLHAYIYNTYEYPRQKRVELVAAWVNVIDPDEKLYRYKWKEKKKRVATSRSPTRRLLKRVAESLLNKYGPASDNLKFRSENWNNILKFEEYVYQNVYKGYDSNVAFEVLDA